MKRRIITTAAAAIIALVAMLSVVIGKKEEPAPADAPKIKSDLVLTAKLESAKTIQPGQLIGIELALENRSGSATHRVIKPGDGSSVGWREPHVFFTVKHQGADGKWGEAPRKKYGRCGLFDTNWAKDFVDLAPGEKLELKSWVPSINYFWEFQRAGNYQIRAHYAFGGHRKGGKVGAVAKTQKLPQEVRDIPNFELVSKPIKIKVERPLDVKVKVKRVMTANQPVALSKLLDVTLVNNSDREIEVASPTLHGVRLGVEIDGQHAGWRPTVDPQTGKLGIKKKLKNGQSVALLGTGEFPNGLDGEWTYPGDGTVRVRVSYAMSSSKPATQITSEWVEVKVVPAPAEKG